MSFQLVIYGTFCQDPVMLSEVMESYTGVRSYARSLAVLSL